MLPSLQEIEKRRKNLGLNQKQLAKLVGVSQSLIAKIEAGKINPSYIKTKAIFDSLEALEMKREIKAGEVVHKRVVGIDVLEPISKATKTMRETGFSQLPVFDGKHVVGSVTEKTVLKQILEGRDIAEISRLPVSKIMDPAFPRVDENTPLTAVSGLLQYEPAVLVTRKGEVTGIITKADLLKVVQAL